MAGDFVFATCLPGLEPALKLDVARARPELKFAYSRPGLVTFKSSRTVTPDDTPGSVFARVWGKSIGAASDPASAVAQLAGLGAVRVHAFPRDPDAMIEGPPAERAPAESGRRGGTERPGARFAAERRGAMIESSGGALNARGGVIDLAPWQLGDAGPAQLGELVADVIVAADEPVWLGLHRHDITRPPHAGGAIPVEVPADAPSRAYAKIEEAIAWAQLPLTAKQVAVEIGAAPGGAVYALARRGLDVYGVDTGELAPHVAALPNVHVIAKKVGALRWEELPPRVDWLLLDVNLAPQVALHEVARLMPKLEPTLQGAVFTLKLNDWTFVDELPTLVERIRKMGFTDVRMRHLPSNRREVCAVALTDRRREQR